MKRQAVFSANEKYRYTLWREWGGILEPGDRRYVNFICLNPSTATDTKDDNTIRRCTRFARLWGYTAMCVTNIFAFRSTDPAGLLTVRDPIGPQNDDYILEIASEASLVICAWSQHAGLNNRGPEVRDMLKGWATPHYLKMSKTGHPYHPLYLPSDTKPQIWGDV